MELHDLARKRPPLAPWVTALCGNELWVYYDEDCGVCQAAMRLLLRVDLGGRLTFYGFGDDIPLPPEMDRATLEARRADEIVVYAPRRGWVKGGAAGMVSVVSALPLMGLLVWPFRLPGLSHLAEFAKWTRILGTYTGWDRTKIAQG